VRLAPLRMSPIFGSISPSFFLTSPFSFFPMLGISGLFSAGLRALSAAGAHREFDLPLAASSFPFRIPLTFLRAFPVFPPPS